MKNEKNTKLALRQLDRKLLKFSEIEGEKPVGGWIPAIRNSLNMSLRQLGDRLSISPQSVKEIEQREKDESITLKNLREAGNALNLKLVYGFIPKDGSLEKMIEKKAMEIAKDIVMRTSQTMKLEDQENSAQRIQEAIRERAEQIKNEMPKYLWD